MKEQDPFNPAMPAEFKLLTESGAADQEQSPPGTTTEFTAGAEKAKRKSSRARKQATGSRGKKKCKVSWQRMKENINAKLSGLDRQKLKQVLAACGIAGG